MSQVFRVFGFWPVMRCAEAVARVIVDAGGSVATLLRAALWTRGAFTAISV